jgi:translation initiation factor IF-1
VPREDAFQVEGTVVEVLKEALVRVELSNRHRLLAHGGKKVRSDRPRLAPGHKVKVELSPFDLSKGRIVLEKSN